MRILHAARKGTIRLLAVVVVAMAAAAAASAAAPARSTPPAETAKNVSTVTPELRRILHAAAALAARGDPAASAIAFEAAASHADFALLRPAQRGELLLYGARLAVDAGDFARAGRLGRAAAAADDGVAETWYLLGQVEAIEHRDEAAALAFARLARGWPEIADDLPQELVGQVLHELGLDSAANREMLEALHAAEWTPDGVVPTHAWAQLALIRAEKGDVQGARAALDDAVSPTVAAWVRSDRRFDALVAPDDPRFDPLHAAEVEIARLRAAAAARPASLEPLRELGHALLLVGRNGETLALVDDVLADTSRFDDAGDLPWMLNQRAIALRRLGRDADALAALTEAASIEESGRPNVSQALNLGSLLVDMERPREALAAIARVEGMSGYGLLVQSAVRLRAYRQLGLEDDAAVWFGRIRDGREDGPRVWLDALVLTGDADAAADWMATLLADPDRRAMALDWCQDYLRSEPLPGLVPELEARRALLARADVKAAVEAVGRCGAPGIHHSVGID